MLGFAVGDGGDGGAIEGVDSGAGVGEEDGGMSRDKELRAAGLVEVVDDAEEELRLRAATATLFRRYPSAPAGRSARSPGVA